MLFLFVVTFFFKKAEHEDYSSSYSSTAEPTLISTPTIHGNRFEFSTYYFHSLTPDPSPTFSGDHEYFPDEYAMDDKEYNPPPRQYYVPLTEEPQFTPSIPPEPIDEL